MHQVLEPFRFVLITVAGWMNQQQQFAIDYLREENRVLREQLGDRRLRLCMAPLIVLMCMAGLVLLIACANVATASARTRAPTTDYANLEANSAESGRRSTSSKIPSASSSR